jgi:hypothetical protein
MLALRAKLKQFRGMADLSDRQWEPSAPGRVDLETAAGWRWSSLERCPLSTQRGVELAFILNSTRMLPEKQFTNVL